MHSETLSLIPLLHILLRELILSAWHHVAFSGSYTSCLFFCFLFFKFCFNFSLSFLPSLPLSPFSFVFLLSSAYSANLEFLSGIGFHYLVRRPLKITSMAITWFSLPFSHCVVCCYVAWMHVCMAACMVVLGQERSSRLFVRSITCGEIEDCHFFILVQSTLENQKVTLLKSKWIEMAASVLFYFRGVKQNWALAFVFDYLR